MQQPIDSIPIEIIVGDQVFRAICYVNPTAQSLVDQMPFSIELKDYGGMEKIFYPQETLSLKGAPEGADPEIGDIMCYGPWGNIALFYKDFGYASGLIPVGHVDNIPVLVQALKKDRMAIFKPK